VGTTPTGLTAPPPPQPPKVFYRPNQQRQSTEDINYGYNAGWAEWLMYMTEHW